MSAGWGIAASAVLLPTALLGMAQLAVYARPHPWESASQWIYAHLPAGATIAVEHWDHPLPIPLPGEDAGRYVILILPVMDDETPEKLAQLETALRESDALVLASARGYGATARQPARYAATLDWYARMLEEREVLAFGRCPRLGPLALSDDPLADAGLPTPLSLAQRCGAPYALRLPRLDESFRVYDAPTVLLALGPRLLDLETQDRLSHANFISRSQDAAQSEPLAIEVSPIVAFQIFDAPLPFSP